MSVKLFCDRCDGQIDGPENVVTVVVKVLRDGTWESREFMLCGECAARLDLNGFMAAQPAAAMRKAAK